MKKLPFQASEFDKIDPKSLVLCLWVARNDILVRSGDELLADYEGSKSNPTLREVVEWNLEDVSGNSFEFVLVFEGKPCLLFPIDWDN